MKLELDFCWFLAGKIRGNLKIDRILVSTAQKHLVSVRDPLVDWWIPYGVHTVDLLSDTCISPQGTERSGTGVLNAPRRLKKLP
jgi:hypothetical protein